MRQLNKKEVKKITKESKRDQEIYLVLENIQYARNVASIIRTADAAGVRRLYLTGISHKPPFGKELRQVSRSKEESVEWKYVENTGEVMEYLRNNGFYIIAIELTDDAIPLARLKDTIRDKKKICFVAGSEVFGVKRSTLEKCNASVTIPMYGRGASLNVST